MTKEETVQQIKECDRDIKKHTDIISDRERRKIQLFKGLSDICEHNHRYNTIDTGVCRHESLKREAEDAGCNAYNNGCTLSLCPLFKG